MWIWIARKPLSLNRKYASRKPKPESRKQAGREVADVGATPRYEIGVQAFILGNRPCICALSQSYFTLCIN